MNSDRQQMQINKYDWYEVCVKTTSENMKTQTQHDFEKFQWKNYMNYTSCHNEVMIW